jgi:hypothetical protein
MKTGLHTKSHNGIGDVYKMIADENTPKLSKSFLTLGIRPARPRGDGKLSRQHI